MDAATLGLIPRTVRLSLRMDVETNPNKEENLEDEITASRMPYAVPWMRARGVSEIRGTHRLGTGAEDFCSR